MKGLPKAILFDLDDTIISEGVRSAILLQVAEQYSEHLLPFSPAQVADKLEDVLEAFWSSSAASRAARLGLQKWGIHQAREQVIREAFEQLGINEASSVAAEFARAFTDFRTKSSGLFPGAWDTISFLKNANVRLALVTNGGASTQREKLSRFKLAGLFDHIQIEGEHGFGKPEERAYWHAMDALQTSPEDTWMVGDHLEWEVAAPQRLGIFAIWHDHRGVGLPPNSPIRPDRIIRQIPELLELSG